LLIMLPLEDSPGDAIITSPFGLNITAATAPVMVKVAKRPRAKINQYRRMSPRNSVLDTWWCLVERAERSAEVCSFTDSVCEVPPEVV